MITFRNFLPILLLALGACSPPVFKSNYETQYSPETLDSNLQEYTLTTEQFELRYMAIGQQDLSPVVFIHGTPGGWDTFKYILGNPRLQERFRMISIDRLGWGKSQKIVADTDKEQSNVETSFEQQAAAIAEIIRHETKDQPVILVGHSLGASIAPRVAMDFPELVKGLMLISGTLEPKLGKPRWYNNVADYWPVSSFLSSQMAQANIEIMALRTELTTMQQAWAKLQMPVTVIQGTKDRLVSPKNVHFLRQELQHLGPQLRMLELEKVGHFIPWEQTHVIEKELFDLQQRINQPIASQ